MSHPHPESEYLAIDHNNQSNDQSSDQSTDGKIEVSENAFFTPLQLHSCLDQSTKILVFKDGLENKVLYKISKLPNASSLSV